MATLDQNGNIVSDEPVEQLEEFTITGKRPPMRYAGIDWNGVLTALIAAGAVYLLQQLTSRRRRRR